MSKEAYSCDYVTVIEAGQPAREAHGEAWGGQLVKLTPGQVEALRNGKQLAINVMDEYVLFLEGPMADDIQNVEG